ncbi:unnamed protein product [Musa hybrid cultivar]
MSIGELPCTYAAVILHDEDLPITAERIATLVKAENVKIDSYWSPLFAKLLEKKNVDDLILSEEVVLLLLSQPLLPAPAVVLLPPPPLRLLLLRSRRRRGRWPPRRGMVKRTSTPSQTTSSKGEFQGSVHD